MSTHLANKKVLQPELSPELISQFVMEATELLDGMEQELLNYESQGQITSIESTFRSVHSLKGNALSFNYNALFQLCHNFESLLDMLRSNPQQATQEQSSFLFEFVDTIRKTIQNLAQTGEDLVPNSGQLEKKTKSVFDKFFINKRPPKQIKDIKFNRSKEVKQSKNVIRVEVEKLDKLMDLVGEIVTSEAIVAHHPTIRKADDLHLTATLGTLNKNIQHLQELATSMRLIPLKNTFLKMQRVARDVAKKLNKKIVLRIIGEETRVDRSIIEKISDPLIHLIRNAADHGIEDAAQRKKLGKKIAGEIKISAKRHGKEVWIAIADDGCGLDRKKIVSKAKEQNLLSIGEENIADALLFRHILKPGFSTSQEVSEISGRGVGLDVVLKNLEQINGTIDIDSKKDVGTTFTLKFPITTTIVESLLTRIGTNFYAIPILDIKETRERTSTDITHLVDGQESVEIRGELVPIIDLRAVYGAVLQPETENPFLVVSEQKRSRVAYMVDEILGQQQLVGKPVPKYINTLKGISGCTILRTGEIAFILDLGCILNQISHNA